MVTDLKIHTVKYLQDLVPLLHSTLSNPFGPDNPPLLLAGIAASRAVVLNAHPRLWRWRAELLSGVCSCWIYILEEENERTERKGRGVDAAGMLERVKSELKGAVYLLREAIRNPTVLGDEDPGVKDAKENIELEVDGLIRANECLRDLFAGIDPNDGKYFGIV